MHVHHHLGNKMTEERVKAEKVTPDANRVTIESKYGPIEVNLNQSILFPHGLLGMPANTDYSLVHFPKANMDQFKLLQNLNDHELSFAVLPIATEAEIFDKVDVDEACSITQIIKQNLVILAIVSVQRTPEEVKVTANMRAPLLIDSERRLGIQYVFPSNKYEIRHILSRTKNN